MFNVADAGDRFLLSGELDMATAADLLAVVQPSNGSVRLDLQNLTFMDSQGLQALLRIWEALDGGELILSGAGGEVLRVLELTRIDQITGIRIEPAPTSRRPQTEMQGR
jgi:anti-anti-sigma factor